MIEYYPGTCIDVPSDEVKRQMLRYASGRGIIFPEEYVSHLAQHYGGVPLCQELEIDGELRYVGRFYNYLLIDEVPLPFIPSWRQSNDDIRLDYSVPYLDYFIEESLEVDEVVVPIAGVDVNGINCRELSSQTSAICWSENSKIVLVDSNEIIEICDSFAEFLSRLRLSTAPTVIGTVDRFGNPLF